MSNKSLGTQFEAEFAQLLARQGYWVHRLTQNSSGQPADIIAVKNGHPYLIDCKVCSNGKFDTRRMEENQITAMSLWKDRGNGNGWFALKLADETIRMLSYPALQVLQKENAIISTYNIVKTGYTIEEWLVQRE